MKIVLLQPCRVKQTLCVCVSLCPSIFCYFRLSLVLSVAEQALEQTGTIKSVGCHTAEWNTVALGRSHGCESNYDNVTFCLRNKSLEATLGSILASNNLSHDAAGPGAWHQLLFWAKHSNACSSQQKGMFMDYYLIEV